MRPRLPAEWHFRYCRTFGRNVVREPGVIRRVDMAMSAGEHGDCSRLQAGAVGGSIDTARQAGHDDESRAAKVARHSLGKFHTRSGSVARADNGDLRSCHDIDLSAHREQRRRVVDHLQPRRISGLTQGDEFDAGGLRSLDFGSGLIGRAYAERSCSAATAREFR